LSHWIDTVAKFKDCIEKALEPGKADEEMSKGLHINVKQSDCWTLCNDKWLNDQVR